MKIDLSIFTNFTSMDVDQLPVFATLQSFATAFDLNEFANIRVFCHAAPLSIPFDVLRRRFGEALPGRTIELYSTRNLADGYVRSLRASDADILYQLEHDYTFTPASVRHTLADMARAMKTAGIPYLRFNIGPNEDNGFDRLTPFDMAGIPCCKTTIFSNRPHLLDRAYALEHYLPVIDVTRGTAHGIEENLTAAFHLGWIYGPLGNPRVIHHTDGRQLQRDLRRQSLSLRLIEFFSRHAKWARDKLNLGRYGRVH
ncbi:MAG: hypothetical protein ACRECO_18335 [Xanthobacteraceae bacterium]